MRYHEFATHSPLSEDHDGNDNGDMEKPDYMSGRCHVFAIALNRLFGFGFLVLTDKSERYPGGATSVHHVYAIDRAGNAYDSRGKHDAADIIAQWKNADAGSRHRPGVVTIATKAGLRKYVASHADDWSRPLDAYSEAMVRCRS